MKLTQVFIFLLLLSSCSNEKPAEVKPVEQTAQGVDVNAVDSITKLFMLPDSIDTRYIIATYVELDPESHTLLLYTGADKKNAKQIRYLNDGNVTIEPLDVVSETELRSKANNSLYLITDSTVIFKTGSGQQKEHFRTDANN